MMYIVSVTGSKGKARQERRKRLMQEALAVPTTGPESEEQAEAAPVRRRRRRRGKSGGDDDEEAAPKGPKLRPRIPYATFKELTEKHADLLIPIAVMQRIVQRRCLGTKFWRTATKHRQGLVAELDRKTRERLKNVATAEPPPSPRTQALLEAEMNPVERARIEMARKAEFGQILARERMRHMRTPRTAARYEAEGSVKRVRSYMKHRRTLREQQALWDEEEERIRGENDSLTILLRVSDPMYLRRTRMELEIAWDRTASPRSPPPPVRLPLACAPTATERRMDDARRSLVGVALARV